MKNNDKTKKFNPNVLTKFITCSCGGKAKLKTITNYPHGKKSSPTKSQFYQCEDCKKTNFELKKEKGGQK